MNIHRFCRWAASSRSSWSRVGASAFAPLVVLFSIGCSPLETPIQRAPSNETPAERIKAQERIYQAKFEQQPPDPAAKTVTVQRLAQVTHDLAGTGVRVECRRTLCRIETQHENDAALQKFIQTAFMNPQTAWRGPFAVVRVDRKQGDGPVSALVFLGEEHHDAPKTTEAPAKAPAQGESAPPTKPEKP